MTRAMHKGTASFSSDSTVECDFSCFSPPALNYFLQSTFFFSFQNKARSCVPRMPVKRKGNWT